MRIPSTAAIVVSAFLCFTACRQDMQDQPKYKPLGASKFFADGREARPIPAGTIARDELNDSDPFHRARRMARSSLPFRLKSIPSCFIAGETGTTSIAVRVTGAPAMATEWLLSAA